MTRKGMVVWVVKDKDGWVDMLYGEIKKPEASSDGWFVQRPDLRLNPHYAKLIFPDINKVRIPERRRVWSERIK